MLAVSPRNAEAVALVRKYSRLVRLTTVLFALALLLAGGGYFILRSNSTSQTVAVNAGIVFFLAGAVTMCFVLVLRWRLDAPLASGAVVAVSDELKEEYRNKAEELGEGFDNAELYSYQVAVNATKKEWMDGFEKRVQTRKNTGALSA